MSNSPSFSQVSCVGRPQPKSWDDFERGCIGTFGGGYRTQEEREIFQHGMKTVFSLLRHEFPSAEHCKAAPELLSACKAVVEEDGFHGSALMRKRIDQMKDVISKAEGK